MNLLSKRIFLLCHFCHQRFYQRSPIIGVLGHVDHGKTTLIDSLRSTNNVSLEAGGITQINSIFQHTIPEDNFKFTIVDTPGHAAFSKMRATGTVLTDVAILVVDAGEGVKPQTRECIELLNANNVPIVVALNKIDLPKANVDLCYEMLFEEGIELTQIGGDVPSVSISALHGTNVPELMKTVRKVTDTLDLTCTTEGIMEGVVFDIKPDKRKLIVTTLLVRSGSISKGDTMVTDTQTSSIRELLSLEGDRLSVGLPGMPVRVIGPQQFRGNLSMGGTIYSLPKPKRIKEKKERNMVLNKLQNKINNIVHEEKLHKRLLHGQKKISFFLCADSKSTLEILHQMLDVETDEVVLSVFDSSVNFLTPQQIALAESINAQIVLFNVKPLDIETTATVHHYDIIYDLASAINSAIDGVLPPNIEKKELGKGIIAEVHGTKKKRVVGVNKLTGKFLLGMNFTISRSGFEIWDGSIDTLRFVKSPILETTSDMTECGVSFAKHAVPDLINGDVIECYKNERVPRTLLSSKFYGQEQAVEADKRFYDP